MTTTKDLADSATFTVLARIAMLVATAALPAVGWMLARGISGVDEIGHKVDTIQERVQETNGNMKLLQVQEALQSSVLQDHETRMRYLERGKLPN